ncbi:hypothetical protein MJO47_09370 [Desulfuromonas sp. KJ2020]|uniref:hypothetical protein n=1 Tax=Desulfuromonas sp. KJ2020 TaxID=2919173 RepID=UPI0020A74336|nr:hypothetical protein [Desulfuromonas sp. KJ2020]MCP3177307.1 hypothetical protein [Desulfuromonas sp. KJ2020]
MSEQYLALVEESNRGADPGSGYLFYPVTGNLQPKFNVTDESRKEFRGQDTALGDASVRRLSSNWEHPVSGYVYSGAELDLMLKHVFGFKGARTAVDTTAFKGLFRPLRAAYGAGNPLGNSAIGIIPNTDEGGTTMSQYHGGGRPKSLTLNGEPGGEITMELALGGAGPWVGDADQAAIPGVAFPSALPFFFAEARFYIGAGIARTGVAPDFTDIAPGAMLPFYPDNFNLTITPGIEDKEVGNGVRGPSKTERTAQFVAELGFTLDYEDPDSGFSSAAEYKKTYTGPNTNSLLIVLDNGQLAGSTNQNYQMIIDLPLMHAVPDPMERNNEGKTPKNTYKLRSLLDSSVGYPVAIMTINKNAA